MTKPAQRPAPCPPHATFQALLSTACTPLPHHRPANRPNPLQPLLPVPSSPPAHSPPPINPPPPQAARILDYLGSHVLLLTSMSLRDYLELKVELEGTSGEGSVQVRLWSGVGGWGESWRLSAGRSRWRLGCGSLLAGW